MKNSINYILSNFVFITRIPIKYKFEYKSDSGNVKFFPLVGIVLGLILFIFHRFFELYFSPILSSVLIVTINVFLTGGIHLDGLSDMSDGIFSYRDKDRVIEIMKDSHIGAMGVLSLIIVILLKIVLINEIINNKLDFFIVLYPMIGRLGIVDMCFLGKPINKSKLGAGFIGNMNIKEFVAVNIIYILMSYVILKMLMYNMEIIYIPIIFIGVFFSMFYMVKKITEKIDGISGDILGAGCEVSEVISIFIMILISNFIKF